MQYTFVNFTGRYMCADIFARSRNRIPAVDATIAAIIQDPDASGQLASPLVRVLTEIGYSPVVAGTGRGHSPGACSLLVVGGPVPRGQVVCETGLHGDASEQVRHVPDDLLASLYRWLKLDWQLMLPRGDGRLNTAGVPIPELGIV